MFDKKVHCRNCKDDVDGQLGGGESVRHGWYVKGEFDVSIPLNYAR